MVAENRMAHVQAVGLNVATKKDRHRAEVEIFLLTLPLIGFFRFEELIRLEGVRQQTVDCMAASKEYFL